MPVNYSRYPPNWKSEIRPRILKRANNCCEKCKVKNYQSVFRGIYQGKEVYQYADGSIYSYPDCEHFTTDAHALIKPVGKDKAIKIILTIAHLDHDETNWNVKDDRLKALCQKCHLIYDIQEKKKRKAHKKYQHSIFPVKY